MLKIFATPGMDPGLLFRRSSIETRNDPPKIVTTILDDVKQGDTSVTISNVDKSYSNSVITLKTDDTSETYTVQTSEIANGKQTLNISPPLKSPYFGHFRGRVHETGRPPVCQHGHK